MKHNLAFLKKFETNKVEYKEEKQGYPSAYWKNIERNDTFTIIFPYPAAQVTAQVTAQVEMRDRIAKILKFCEEPRSLKEMMQFLELKHRVYFLKEILETWKS